jgi:beta-phosphoglucomutase-like phosphatase (HAD superfamily)
LNVDGSQCIAFEDSNNGVRAAVAANMMTFQIPDLVEPCDEVKELKPIILPSLHDALSYLKQQ